jgi:hypothetical protein
MTMTTPAAMTVSYSNLLERVGRFLFGQRSGYSDSETSDIEDCIQDGLRMVYTAHDWSFFRPLADITTTAPYATGTVEVVDGVVALTDGVFPSWAADGTLRVSSRYYSVATRDSDTQVTLDDTTVDLDAGTTFELGRLDIPLPVAFEAVSGDSDLTYYPGQNELYPPVKMRHDSTIRTLQQDGPHFSRPTYYSVRTVEFDPTTGSRKRMAFYPTPDSAYVLRVPMILRPTMIDDTNQYPVGGETLAAVITEACLAAAEHNLDDGEGIHEKRFLQLLPLAIRADQEKSSPTTLGGDAPRSGRSGVSSYWLRSARLGVVSLDGVDL